ncbi:hypothetical protein Fcan01_26553 [Folsomia candida]|uniref:Uncharacterized protein n=1 Tax=Folsomia candida TaxID=158441 RepID=A0A226D0B6_FOLCA|nr:hypothetical protein Fcan01_26553 [Folsomia candida]
MFPNLLSIFLAILHLSCEQKPTFDNFLQLFTDCTLEIFTSKNYDFDDPRFWISETNLNFPKLVKDIKMYTRLVSDAGKNKTVKEYLLSKENFFQSINAKDCCRIGFIDLQEGEELDLSKSTYSLFRLMAQNPQPHHVFIRVGIPAPADFPLPTEGQFDYTLRFLIANIYEMYIRGNTVTVLLPNAYFELVFSDKEANILKSDMDPDQISKRERHWRDLDTMLQSGFRNMENMEIYVKEIKLTKYEIDQYYKICGIYKIRDSPSPFSCITTTLRRKFNFTIVFTWGSSSVNLYYARVNNDILRGSFEDVFLQPNHYPNRVVPGTKNCCV